MTGLEAKSVHTLLSQGTGPWPPSGMAGGGGVTVTLLMTRVPPAAPLPLLAPAPLPVESSLPVAHDRGVGAPAHAPGQAQETEETYSP